MLRMTKGFLGWRCQLWRTDGRSPRGHRTPTACRSALRDAWRVPQRVHFYSSALAQRCSRRMLSQLSLRFRVSHVFDRRARVMGVSALRGGSGSQCEARRGTPPAECAVKAEPLTELRNRRPRPRALSSIIVVFLLLVAKPGLNLVLLAQKIGCRHRHPLAAQPVGIWQHGPRCIGN